MNDSVTAPINETLLLRRLRETGDAEAFAHITRQYAGMVYGTCLRITGDAHHAADAAQETFFHLLKHAGRISGSLGCWLHQVAMRRAIDLIRRDASRRQREQAFAAQTLVDADQWANLSPLVDEAMEELDEGQRQLLVRHFLQGESTVQMAAALGVSQPTVSRRVNEALAQLRDKLRARGVLVGAATLGALMGNATQSAPAAVLAELGKMSLAASSAGAVASTVGVAGALKLKLALAAVVTVAGLSAWLVAQRRVTPPALDANSTTVQATAPPSATPPGAALALAAETDTKRATDSGAANVNSAPPPSILAGGPGATTPGGWAAAVGPPIFAARLRMGIGPPPMTRPEGLLQQFAAALSRGDHQRLERCFVAGGKEWEEFRRVLQDPRTDEERALRQGLESLGAPVEVQETTITDDGLLVKWHATVKKPFGIVENGTSQSWQEGDKCELHVCLKQVGEEWRIAAFTTGAEEIRESAVRGKQ